MFVNRFLVSVLIIHAICIVISEGLFQYLKTYLRQKSFSYNVCSSSSQINLRKREQKSSIRRGKGAALSRCPTEERILPLEVEYTAWTPSSAYILDLVHRCFARIFQGFNINNNNNFLPYDIKHVNNRLPLLQIYDASSPDFTWAEDDIIQTLQGTKAPGFSALFPTNVIGIKYSSPANTSTFALTYKSVIPEGKNKKILSTLDRNNHQIHVHN